LPSGWRWMPSPCLWGGDIRRAVGGRAAFRLSFHFGLFQFMMPVMGWFLGRGIARSSHRLINGSLRPARLRRRADDPRRFSTNTEKSTPRSKPGFHSCAAAVATSIDALAIGLSLGVLQVKIWYPSVIIGVVTSGLSLFGLRVGTRLGAKVRQAHGNRGGALLSLLGLRILLLHLFG